MNKKLTQLVVVSMMTLIMMVSSVAVNAADNSNLKALTHSVQQSELGTDNSKTGKVVRVGYSIMQGYEEGENGERKSGFGYEYLQMISYHTGWKYEYVDGSLGDLIEMLKEGKIDILGNLTYTDERANYFNFSSYPQGKEQFMLYGRLNDTRFAATNPQSFNGASIGVTRGSFQEGLLYDWLMTNGVEAEVVLYDAASYISDAFIKGEIDAFVNTDAVSGYGFVPIIYLGYSDFYFGVAKYRLDLLEEINNALYEIQSVNPHYNDEVQTRYAYGQFGMTNLSIKERDWLTSHDYTIRLGYLDDNRPYSNMNAETGELEGIMSVLVDTALKQFGVNIKAIPYHDNVELVEALDSGAIDAMGPNYSDFWLAEQWDLVQTSAFYETTPVLLYKNRLDNGSMIIAGTESSVFCPHVLRIMFPNMLVKEYDDASSCLDAVLSGEADGFVVTPSILNRIKQYSDDNNLQSAELPDSVQFCLCTGKTNVAISTILNKIISLSTDELRTSEIYQSAGQIDKRLTFIEFIKEYAGILLAIVLIITLLILFIVYSLLRRARQAEAQALTALHEAEEANMTKTRFLSRMSHDIRTPLNGIIGIIEINEKHPEDIELLVENRKKAKVAAKHLLSLVNDVLEMSKLDDKNISLTNEPFDINDLFTNVYTLANLRAAEHGISLSYEGTENLKYRYLYGSPLHLRQILLNIVNNAIKYNKPGGYVSCSYEMVSEEVDTVTYRISVRDNGIGMSEEFKEHIFEPFSQEHTDARSTYQGTGMGMAIVKSLVTKMNGRIDVESQLGEGSTFSVTIPFVIDHNPEIHTVEKLVPKDIKGMRVLVAEDNELNTEIIKCLLEEAGLRVTTVPNGQEAVNMFLEKSEGTFDAILMDIMMPVMDGYEATKQIRLSDKKDSGVIPIIAMSANAFAEDVQQAKRAGMTDHIAKPIDIQEVYMTLGKYRGR